MDELVIHTRTKEDEAAARALHNQLNGSQRISDVSALASAKIDFPGSNNKHTLGGIIDSYTQSYKL